MAASVFGEQRKLEPMPPETKARWRKEIDWLLSVTDHIVEFVPSQQVSKDGTNMEVPSSSLANQKWPDKIVGNVLLPISCSLTSFTTGYVVLPPRLMSPCCYQRKT